MLSATVLIGAFNLYHSLGIFSRRQTDKETICIKCQILFSGKNKKNVSKCCLLKILPRVLSVKGQYSVNDNQCASAGPDRHAHLCNLISAFTANLMNNWYYITDTVAALIRLQADLAFTVFTWHKGPSQSVAHHVDNSVEAQCSIIREHNECRILLNCFWN